VDHFPSGVLDQYPSGARRSDASAAHAAATKLAPPPPVREPQRVVRMMRTHGPRGVDKRVVEVPLDVINDIADILRRNAGI